MTVFVVVTGTLIVAMLAWLLVSSTMQVERPTAREIAKRRYARGEIDRTTFERIMDDLNDQDARYRATGR